MRALKVCHVVSITPLLFICCAVSTHAPMFLKSYQGQRSVSNPKEERYSAVSTGERVTSYCQSAITSRLSRDVSKDSAALLFRQLQVYPSCTPAASEFSSMSPHIIGRRPSPAISAAVSFKKRVKREISAFSPP